jgi:hypothetical protein
MALSGKQCGTHTCALSCVWLISRWLQTGKLTCVKRVDRGLIIAHGVLMSIAFALLFPTGILLARYRWVRTADAGQPARMALKTQSQDKHQCSC